MKFTIYGAPRTKKNSSVMVTRGKPRLLPSKQWREWVRTCAFDRVIPWPVIRECNCTALFYRDANRGDAVGYYQGLADLLEKRGIIQNDVLIRSWDGSRLLVDKENPRVEVELTEV